MRDILIEFMDSLRDYVAESGTNIAHDERDSSEFVDIFIKQGQLLPIDSVSHCSKGKLAEEFQKGYKEGYEDGANAAANDIAANPHKMY